MHLLDQPPPPIHTTLTVCNPSTNKRGLGHLPPSMISPLNLQLNSDICSYLASQFWREKNMGMGAPVTMLDTPGGGPVIRLSLRAWWHVTLPQDRLVCSQIITTYISFFRELYGDGKANSCELLFPYSSLVSCPSDLWCFGAKILGKYIVSWGLYLVPRTTAGALVSHVTLLRPWPLSCLWAPAQVKTQPSVGGSCCFCLFVPELRLTGFMGWICGLKYQELPKDSGKQKFSILE